MRRLGDWQSTVVSLDSDQVSDFLARHPDVRQKVTTFQSQIIARGGYHQGDTGYAISEWGFAVSDPTFLNVTVFPDSVGQLRYTGNVPNQVAAEVNKPPYVSPTGGPADPFTAFLEAVPWIVGAYIGLTLLNTVRGK